MSHPGGVGNPLSYRSLAAAIIAAASILAPPPNLTISRWADSKRILSPEASASKGRWNTDTAPFQREIMDAICDPEIQDVVWQKSAQVGATEILLNILGYYIDQDPSPILLLEPTLEMAEAFSKDRLSPMLRDSPCFAGKISSPRSRDGGNTLLHKAFPGGQITLAGANSPSSLAMRPIRIVLCDEVDRYPASAGAEGSPVRLAFKRTNNFWNRKRVQVGTPTLKGASAIEKAFQQSDQRFRYLPCPHCGEFQVLKWGRVVWAKAEDGTPQPDTAVYACEHCAAPIDLDAELNDMDRKGKWIAHNPRSKVVGFHINELYSPWKKLHETVEDFLAAKFEGPESFKTWINTALGETWDPQDHVELNAEGMLARREAYPAQVPWGVGCMTAGIDTQDDRLELIVKGWGRANESWLIHREVIWGSPAMPETWEKLDRLLLEGYRHASGRLLFIEAAAVDIGGSHTQHARDFAKPRIPRRVFPIRGSNQPAAPLIKKSGNKRIKEWHIGTIAAKDTILLTRLKIDQVGPGYMHFPVADWCDLDYFKQLATSEHITKDRKGRNRRWEKVTHDTRNEALDCEVYAWAIFTLLNIKATEMEDRLARLEAPFEPPPQDAAVNSENSPKPAPPRKRRVLSKGLFT